MASRQFARFSLHVIQRVTICKQNQMLCEGEPFGNGPGPAAPDYCAEFKLCLSKLAVPTHPGAVACAGHIRDERVGQGQCIVSDPAKQLRSTQPVKCVAKPSTRAFLICSMEHGWFTTI